jgi:dihydroneopterin aldolase
MKIVLSYSTLLEHARVFMECFVSLPVSPSMNLDSIFLHKLEVMARIGVLDHEKQAPQPILLDIDLGIDLRPSVASGLLADTLDYAELVRALSVLCMKEHTELVETLAEKLAQFCLQDQRVQWVRVTLGKPKALTNCINVGVSMLRYQSSSFMNNSKQVLG